MKHKNVLSYSVLMAVLAFGVSACSHGPAVQDYPASASPAKEVSALTADVENAIARQVDVFSPENFEKAHDAWTDAKGKLDKQKDAEDILSQVAESRAYLARAEGVMQLANTNLESVISARQASRNAQVQTFYPTEFGLADEILQDVTSDLEENDLSSAAKYRGKLQASYLNLELMSIKQANLREAKSLIESARSIGAEEFAPRTLVIAEKNVKDTEAFITGNRRDSAQIQARASAALASAKHLFKITNDAKSGKKISNEDMALQFEHEQSKVVAKQGQLNAKQGELNAKQGELARKQGQLDNKQLQLESKEGELTDEKNNVAALAATNDSLESDKAFSKSFEEAQAEFTKEEAEVYKQGNSLVIRLRGLEFPKAQALIQGSNFPLLAKVQKVIKGFGKSSVVVEGHTDSQGGKAVNEKLSTERAKAVQNYLKANDAELTIRSVGFGYQKPLATNKTPAGRAQNRRVDVLISPEGAENL